MGRVRGIGQLGKLLNEPNGLRSGGIGQLGKLPNEQSCMAAYSPDPMKMLTRTQVNERRFRSTFCLETARWTRDHRTGHFQSNPMPPRGWVRGWDWSTGQAPERTLWPPIWRDWSTGQAPERTQCLRSGGIGPLGKLPNEQSCMAAYSPDPMKMLTRTQVNERRFRSTFCLETARWTRDHRTGHFQSNPMASDLAGLVDWASSRTNPMASERLGERAGLVDWASSRTNPMALGMSSDWQGGAIRFLDSGSRRGESRDRLDSPPADLEPLGSRGRRLARREVPRLRWGRGRPNADGPLREEDP